MAAMVTALLEVGCSIASDVPEPQPRPRLWQPDLSSPCFSSLTLPPSSLRPRERSETCPCDHRARGAWWWSPVGVRREPWEQREGTMALSRVPEGAVLRKAGEVGRGRHTPDRDGKGKIWGHAHSY